MNVWWTGTKSMHRFDILLCLQTTIRWAYLLARLACLKREHG
jgi:hypothetical protein